MKIPVYEIRHAILDEIGLRVEKLRSAVKKREIDKSVPVPEIRFDQSEQR